MTRRYGRYKRSRPPSSLLGLLIGLLLHGAAVGLLGAYALGCFSPGPKGPPPKARAK